MILGSLGLEAEFSAHLQRFFDPAVMRRYRPDYVSTAEYMRGINANKGRAALIRAAYDPILPVAAQDPSHALRLSARIART